MSKLIIIVIVAIIAGAIYFEKRRGSGIEKIASSLDFSFTPGQQPLPRELSAAGFDLFTQGPPNINNRADGIRGGREISVFDFNYNAVASGEGSSDMPLADDHFDMEMRRQSVIWLKTDRELPDFDLSPSRSHKRTVAGRFGLNRVTFDGQNGFNQHYTLLARNEERIRELFSPALIDQLAATPDMVIESRGKQLLFYRFEKLPKPESIPGFLSQVEAILDLL